MDVEAGKLLGFSVSRKAIILTYSLQPYRLQIPARVCRDTAIILEEQFAAYGVSAAIARHDTEHPLA